MTAINKILIIRLSSLGDIILSFPLLHILKKKFPEAEIHFLTKETFREILLLNPNINEVITISSSLNAVKKKIKRANYDLIIDIHKNFRSMYLSLLNKAKVVRYNKESVKKFLLVKFKINLFKKVTPVYEKYLLAIRKYLSDNDYSFSLTELNFDKKRSIEVNYIVISPTSRHFTKTYPKEKFVEYIKQLGTMPVVLVGDNSDNDKLICEYISGNCNNVTNLCGKLDMNGLANILYHSEQVFCNDSAILHFADALGKPVTAIFGSTVKEFGFYPQLPGSFVLENRNLYCRPCTHIGRDYCPEGHFKCMLDIQLQIKGIQ